MEYNLSIVRVNEPFPPKVDFGHSILSQQYKFNYNSRDGGNNTA